MSGRRMLVGGNWKMNLLADEVAGWLDGFRSGLEEAGALPADVIVFPSALWIPRVAESLADTPAACGAQDLHPAASGAHTGDLAGPQLASAGCTWTLCGHSERRQNHGESDDLVGRKAAAAIAAGLQPMICVGETGDERKAGRTFEVLDRQLAAALAREPEPFTLAYEPVWAIGTGATASPEQAQEVHRHLRERLADRLGDEAAATRRILYGGSVKSANVAELAAQRDIDGFLVGGASLDPDEFLAIIGGCG